MSIAAVPMTIEGRSGAKRRALFGFRLRANKCGSKGKRFIAYDGHPEYHGGGSTVFVRRHL